MDHCNKKNHETDTDHHIISHHIQIKDKIGHTNFGSISALNLTLKLHRKP